MSEVELLIGLLRREGTYSGVWFQDHLLRAASFLNDLQSQLVERERELNRSLTESQVFKDATLELARAATALSAALDGQEQYRAERVDLLNAMKALVPLFAPEPELSHD